MIAQLRALARDGRLAPTFGYYWLFICLGLDVAILGPTLPALAGQTRASLGQMGLLILVGSIGAMLGTLVSGRIFDRRRGHPVLGVAQLAAAILLALMPFVPWFWLLVAVVACKGLAQGFVNTGANTLLVWTHGEKSGPFMNGLHFFFGLGAFLAPFLVGQLTGLDGGYRWAYLGLAAFAALAGLRMLVLSGSSQPARGKAEAASGSRPPAPASPPYAFVFAAALFLFFYVGAELSFGNWIYTYATSLGLAGEAAAAYLNSAFWLSFTVGRLISIGVAARFTPKQVIPAAVLGSLAFLGLVLLFPASGGVLWAAAVGLGFCMAPVWPTGFTLAGQSIDLSGRLSGLILLGDSFGGMLLPAALGKVIEAAGPRAMVYVIFASLVLNLLAFGGMLRLRPKQ